MAGKRHSASDMALVQQAHDTISSLGAMCGTGSGMSWPFESAKLKVSESALPLDTSHDTMRGHLRTALQLAHGVTDSYSSNGPYIRDTFPGHVVYTMGNQTMKRAYKADTSTPPKISLGEPKNVHVAYVEASTEKPEGSATLLEDESVVTTPTVEEGFVLMYEAVDIELPLKEGARLTAAAPYVAIKLISPGWGSSGYYSAEMLKRDGPGIYKKGSHMYWNHSEESNRNPSELAAVLNEDAKWQDNGAKGPGLYSVAKVFSDYATQVAEKGPHIGVSISAYGKSVEGEAEGRKGKIIQKLAHAESVDFVGKAGRGGEVLLEGQRRGEPQSHEGDLTMTEQETASLREAQTRSAALEKENAGLKLEKNQSLATVMFMEALKVEGALCSVAAAKTLMAIPPLKENGDIDTEKVKDLAKKMKEDFKPIKAAKDGKVVNMGRTTESADEDKANLAELEEGFKEMGLTEAAAKIATSGRF